MEALNEQYLAGYRAFSRQFADFSDTEWEIFTQKLSPKSLNRKELFTGIGETEQQIAYLATGSVRFYFLKDGEELTNYFCFSGEMVSSYNSFLRQVPSMIAVEALEPAEVISLSYADLQILYADERISRKVETFFRKMAEHLLGCYEERVMSFVTQSAEERYESLFRDVRQVLNRIPQHYIANYLGVTPVSLSRIRRRIMERN